MNIDEKYMKICLQLAKQGMRNVAPNPTVGAVLVYQDTIIGKGVTSAYGGNHAEVNCINSVKDEDISLIAKSTLYVSLEPCAHFGKTPPCADLVIKHKIPKVVVSCIDSFSEVSGKGIARMEAAGIDVTVGVLEKEALELNKRFFTFHTKKRPYIILKWAQTQDGYIDIDRNSSTNMDNWITTPASKKLVHQWRAEEQSIMVGTNTALNDNPSLTVREVEGNNPTRIVLDMDLRLPENLHIFDKTVPTLVINKLKNETSPNLEFIQINADKNLLTQILQELYNRDIQSVIIEGGAQILNSFITQKLWDEARVFTGKKTFKKGLQAPKIDKSSKFTTQIDSDVLTTYFND